MSQLLYYYCKQDDGLINNKYNMINMIWYCVFGTICNNLHPIPRASCIPRESVHSRSCRKWLTFQFPLALWVSKWDWWHGSLALKTRLWELEVVMAMDDSKVCTATSCDQYMVALTSQTGITYWLHRPASLRDTDWEMEIASVFIELHRAS